MPPSPFPDLPISGVAFPVSAIAAAAFAYTREHTAEGVYNHCVRSAYWALILARKLAPLAAAGPPDLEAVVLACVLHDMGWALDKALLSDHKRFEVDGADIARRFVLAYRARGGDGAAEWDDARVQTVWDAIALHTTTSIAPFGSAEVAAAHLGIMADFTGPRFPADPWGDPAKQRAAAGEEEEGAVITVDEFREVVGAFPYAGFGAEASKAILCGLCRDKPGSTFDNFVGAFGRAYGLDGEGRGREEYTAMWARATDPANVVGNFDYLQGLLEENKEG